MLSVLSLLSPVFALGQEIKTLAHPVWTTADTTRILKLVGQGYTLMFRDLDSALLLLGKAEQLSRLTGFEDGIGYALAFKGIVYTSKGNYDQGFAAYRQALKYCLNARYIKTALPSLYINIGASYRSSGKYELAGYYYFNALQYLETFFPNHRDILTIYNNLAVVQASLKNYTRAIAYARQAVVLSAAVNNKTVLSAAKLNLGAIYTLMKQHDSAKIYLEEALQVASEIGQTDKRQSILTNIGDLYLETGRTREAIARYREAMQLGGNTHLLHSAILPGYALGTALAQLKQYDEAERALVAALEKADKSGMATGKPEAHRTLAAIYEATGRYREALRHYRAYEALNDSLTGVERMRAVSEVETRYQVGQKDKLLAENRLKILEQERALERNRMRTAGGITFAGLLAGITVIIYYYRQKAEKRGRDMAHLKAVMAGEEKERDRIAQELHDGIGGMLTGMQMKISALAEKQQVTSSDLAGLAGVAADVSQEIQKTARNLTPGVLQQHNLYHVLLHYCEQFEVNGAVHIDLQFMGDTDTLDKSLELALYRVIQELVQNVIKHAYARHVAIQMRRDGQMLYLSVEDDGAGFFAGDYRKGLGLQHVRTRIAALNGYCSIESSPGKGTAVYIEIDMNKIPA